MSPETREAVLALAQTRLELLNSLAVTPSGLSWCAKHTDIADQIVRLLCADLQKSIPSLPPLAVIATGGYGRSELSPYSDIDITLVPSDESSPVLDSAVRTFFQDLHWSFCSALKLDVGYAYRLLGDAPGLDAKTRTGLLDMRLIWGSHDLFRDLDEELRESFAGGEFLLSKISERAAAFDRFNDSPLVTEPQLKEGAGGLRCFHCANWIREAIGEQPTRPTPEYNHIVLLRNLLHFTAGKHQDLLSHLRQEDVAEVLHKDIYSMMSELAHTGSIVHAEYRRACERIRETRFVVAPGVLAVNGEARVLGSADAGQAAVGVAIATQLQLRVADIHVTTKPTVEGPAAVFAVSTGEQTLRNLDRCGLLEQLIPEFTKCRTLMPRDTIHRFTVFEHTMRVVRCLDSIEPGTFLGDVRANLKDIAPLYLAALLHDVGKVDPMRDHSKVSGEIGRKVCMRWGLNETLTKDAVWLVLRHLEMSKFIRIRDIQAPQTIREFARMVKDPDRLAALTLLTWADVNAVAPGAWTQAQDTFLRDLYRNTLAALQGDAPQTPDIAQTRQRLLRQLKGKESEEEVRLFVESLPAHYMTTVPVDVVPLHMQFVRRAIEGQPSVECFHRPDIGATDITVCARDEHGLLSKLLGVFYAYDLSVSGIRAYTTMSDPHVALDVFTLSFAGRPVPAATYAQVAHKVVDVLSGAVELQKVLAEKRKDPDRKQQQFKYTFHEGNPGILEVRAPRGRGMPYRFSRLLAARGWSILSARVGQWAGSGAAAFYIETKDGQPVLRAEVDEALQSIAEKILTKP